MFDIVPQNLIAVQRICSYLIDQYNLWKIKLEKKIT